MNPLRRLVEKMSRGVILKRRLPRDLGRGILFVSPEAGGLKYWRRDLNKADPDLLTVARELVAKSAHVWDIGANVGLFTFAAAFLAGPGGSVLAVEADVDNASLLQRSAAAADKSISAPVTVLAVAITPPGQRLARFEIASRSRASNSLQGFGNTQMGDVRETRVVAGFTLDELLDVLPAPSVLKIDVEGAELSILQGARRLLTNTRPKIVLEVTNTSAKAVAELFGGFGYHVYDASVPASQRRPLDSAPWNTLAVPLSS